MLHHVAAWLKAVQTMEGLISILLLVDGALLGLSLKKAANWADERVYYASTAAMHFLTGRGLLNGKFYCRSSRVVVKSHHNAQDDSHSSVRFHKTLHEDEYCSINMYIVVTDVHYCRRILS